MRTRSTLVEATLANHLFYLFLVTVSVVVLLYRAMHFILYTEPKFLTTSLAFIELLRRIATPAVAVTVSLSLAV